MHSRLHWTIEMSSCFAINQLRVLLYVSNVGRIGGSSRLGQGTREVQSVMMASATLVLLGFFSESVATPFSDITCPNIGIANDGIVAIGQSKGIVRELSSNSPESLISMGNFYFLSSPPVNDTDPYTLFRPREKAHILHARRLPFEGMSKTAAACASACKGGGGTTVEAVEVAVGEVPAGGVGVGSRWFWWSSYDVGVQTAAEVAAKVPSSTVVLVATSSWWRKNNGSG
ncbi:hypothetical protein L1987_75957 [Smallanthus sonchifolius]|uniref:Uncharacterized protein n=1 Tax=Smallanthus sonchifolius TaxID=185202 RepID=A0ACB9A858_9ASTR|nr:hypothetical protein L1987_75957 [Smallanthus sonchifolius]